MAFLINSNAGDEMSFYFVINASGVPVKQEDHLSGFFFDMGADGISENLKFSQLDAEYNVETVNQETKSLNIYFATAPNENVLLKAKAEFSNVEFAIEKQENKDWMAEWKKGFHAFELTEGVTVVPSWEIPTAQGINISIDPGMAFGTGTHATTKIAAELIKEISIQTKSVLDVGTGTGILAVMAEKLGAAKVEATEIEDMAREVAKENVAINQCKITKVLDIQVEACNRSYDIVIANIIDGVLIKIQKDLTRLVKAGGYILLTGVLDEREPNFLKSFDFSGFKKIKRLQKEEWVGFLYQKGL